MKIDYDNLSIKAHAGFSLVDVMVGMVIALLGTIVIFQVFSVSEGIKRTTTGAGNALQNGASALFSLERSLREGGYGIFSSTNLAPLPADPTGTAPVTITPGAANASDSIVINYRQSWDFGSFPPDPVVFASAVPPALTVETITIDAQAQLVSSTIPDPTPGGGTPYATCTPSLNCLPLAGTTTNVISDGIVLLKAEYGTDANGDGVINANEWSQAAPANMLTVYAVRLVLVARSAQPEKPSVTGGTCDTTTTPPIWIDSTALPLDLSGNVGLAPGDDWKCYRYKTFETTVPLRNVVWRAL
ncbi:MAG: PilW family protein [Gallionella sp.]|nr:PilW family protein [Gallionella sp.]